MGCRGLHCDGCGSGSGNVPVVPIILGVIALAFGSAIIAAVEDAILATLITLSVVTVAVVSMLVVRMRRGGVRLVQWHTPEVAAPEPVQALQWPHISAEVISRRDVPAWPAIKD
jgi:hypothetical protein